ncbi:MAG: hypothetical protein K1X74_16150 [Pirellulales bacterium]|nr:hypothetical protein [Pirellulales bacterium]
MRRLTRLCVLVLACFGASLAGADEPDIDRVTPRPAANDAELRRWLENMVAWHRFTPAEAAQATGLSPAQVTDALARFDLQPGRHPRRTPAEPLTVLPYPGGRHPRIGFRDGAIDPQRETKVSVFLPWDDSAYVVADVPEAIWSNLGLTYLAHTHVPTIWSKAGVELPPLEWQVTAERLSIERRLPNGIVFAAEIRPRRDGVQMRLRLTNGTDAPLDDLRVQNCVMLKGAPEFAAETNDNKVFRAPYGVCRNAAGNHWVITAWTPSHRVWGNVPCPCLHADPKFPDCSSGATQEVRGWLSFYEGTDLDGELARLETIGWDQW